MRVGDIEVLPADGDSITALSDKVLALYNYVIANEKTCLQRLNAAGIHRDVRFRRVRLGSIVLLLECRSCAALDALEALYVSKQLKHLLNHTIVTSELRQAVGVSSLTLDAQIPQRSFDSCRDHLLSQSTLEPELSAGESLLGTEPTRLMESAPVLRRVSPSHNLHVH